MSSHRLGVAVVERVRALGDVTALLPAHNEEAGIADAIASLRAQTEPPTEIIVVADNCTDGTEEIARSLGVTVWSTVDNTHKKAGGLNQALAALDVPLRDEDLVLVMDADSLLDRGFIHGARRALEDPDGTREGRGGDRIGGIGGTFLGGPGGGLLGTFQRNEYARYARDVRRLRGKALVLTGTASLFTMKVLREVAAARRDGRLPDKSGLGRVYDTNVLTEDNELSLALMHLGYGILAPRQCTLTTEVMTTWRDLARQRLRWKRGALENIADYGLTRVTASYWSRQILSALGVLVTALYLGTLAWGIATGFNFQPLWLGVSLIFVLERVVTVRTRGWRQMLLAGPLIVEMVYDLFLQGVQALAFAQTFLRLDKKW